MSLSAACRAKDPRACPYHGAVIRMNEAQIAPIPNFHEYYEARKIVEAKEKEGWDEQAYVDALNEGGTIPKSLAKKTRAKKKVVESERASSTDPAAQAGTVYDEIDVVDPDFPDSPRTFYRRKEGVYAGEPDAIRLQANRKLNDKDVEKMASLLGYNYRTTVAGESLGWPERDTPYSFVVGADMTKSSRDDLGMAVEELENNLPTFLNDGSPVLKRGSRGKVAGERAIDGFQEKDLKVEIYYDNVYKA